MRILCFIIVSLLLLPTPVSFAATLHKQVIRSCNDISLWPPYFYRKLEQNKLVTVGYSIDILDKIVAKGHARVDYELMPWPKCLKQAAEGDFDIITDGSKNKEREEKFVYSIPYYRLTPSVLYRKSDFPEGLTLSTQKEVSNYKVCALAGYNYTGFTPHKLDISHTSTNFTDAFIALRNKRCDILLARIEVIYGFKVIGQNYMGQDIAYTAIPGATRIPYHMMVSKKSPIKDELLSLANQVITEMQSLGELQKVFMQYQ